LTTSHKEYKIKENMTITDRQMQGIGKYVKGHLAEWLGEIAPMRPQYDPALLERMVRVEEELKHQRELLLKGFETMEKRFETMEKRFETMEKRFEVSDRHFLALTGRIDRFMIWSLGAMVTVAGIIIAVLKYS